MTFLSAPLEGDDDVTGDGLVPAARTTGPTIAAHDLIITLASETLTYRGYRAGAVRIPALSDRIRSVRAVATQQNTNGAAVLAPDGSILTATDDPLSFDAVWRPANGDL